MFSLRWVWMISCNKYGEHVAPNNTTLNQNVRSWDWSRIIHRNLRYSRSHSSICTWWNAFGISTVTGHLPSRKDSKISCNFAVKVRPVNKQYLMICLPRAYLMCGKLFLLVWWCISYRQGDVAYNALQSVHWEFPLWIPWLCNLLQPHYSHHRIFRHAQFAERGSWVVSTLYNNW